MVCVLTVASASPTYRHVWSHWCDVAGIRNRIRQSKRLGTSGLPDPSGSEPHAGLVCDLTCLGRLRLRSGFIHWCIRGKCRIEIMGPGSAHLHLITSKQISSYHTPSSFSGHCDGISNTCYSHLAGNLAIPVISMILVLSSVQIKNRYVKTIQKNPNDQHRWSVWSGLLELSWTRASPKTCDNNTAKMLNLWLSLSKNTSASVYLNINLRMYRFLVRANICDKYQPCSGDILQATRPRYRRQPRLPPAASRGLLIPWLLVN